MDCGPIRRVLCSLDSLTPGEVSYNGVVVAGPHPLMPMKNNETTTSLFIFVEFMIHHPIIHAEELAQDVESDVEVVEPGVVAEERDEGEPALDAVVVEPDVEALDVVDGESEAVASDGESELDAVVAEWVLEPDEVDGERVPALADDLDTALDLESPDTDRSDVNPHALALLDVWLAIGEDLVMDKRRDIGMAMENHKRAAELEIPILRSVHPDRHEERARRERR